MIRASYTAALLLAALAACQGPSGPADPPDGWGDPASGWEPWGTGLARGAPGEGAHPMSVRVFDRSRNGVAGVRITFRVASGEGTVTPTTVVTDRNGVATANWTFGAQMDTPNLLDAKWGNFELRFGGEVEPVGRITMIAGATQSGVVGSWLPDTIVAQVRTRTTLVPIRGAPVRWGDGVTRLTDANGMTRARYQLPTTAGEDVLVPVVFGDVVEGARVTARPDVPHHFVNYPERWFAQHLTNGGRVAAVRMSLKDRYDNSVWNVPVTFSPICGQAFQPEVVVAPWGEIEAEWPVKTCPDGNYRFTVTAPNGITGTFEIGEWMR